MMFFNSRNTAPLSVLTAMLLATSAVAGDVTVSRVDLDNGRLHTLATGSLPHKPAWVFDKMEFVVADTCGVFYKTKTDIYGDATFAEITENKDHSLAKVRLMAQNRYGPIGISHDGLLLPINLGSALRAFAPFGVAENFNSELDLSPTRLFVAGRSNVPYLAFFDDGRLLGIKSPNAETPEVGFIEPRKGWGKVKHAVTTEIGRGRERHAVLVTIDANGQMEIHVPVEEEKGFTRRVVSMQSRPAGNQKFTGTKKLFAHESEDIVYRWTESGDLFAVDLNKGTEQRLGDAGAFRDGFLTMPDDELYYVESDGSFAACAVKEEVVVVEAPKDMSIVNAADKLNAVAEAHYQAIDKASQESVPSFDGEFAAMEPQIKQLFEKVEAFERTVAGPVREELNAFTSAYGDFYDAKSKLRELTDNPSYLSDKASSWIVNALKEWDGHRLAIAERLVGRARHGFLLGEHATDKAKRSEHYLSAKPWAEWALRFNPGLAEAEEILATADANAASADAAFKQAIQDRQWPEDINDVPGAEALKKKLLAFFQRRHNGFRYDKGARYFAIRLDSRWYVQERNILGEPVEWRISAWVAETVPGDPKHARIHWLEAGTHSADKSTLDYTAGASDSFLIPIERVPADDPVMLEQSRKLLGQ